MGTVEPGIEVPFADVQAVFDRALRGVNLFQVADRAYLLERGAPLDSEGDSFGLWVRECLRAIGKKKGRLRSYPALAKRVRVDLRELRDALRKSPGENPALCEDVAWRIVETLDRESIE